MMLRLGRPPSGGRLESLITRPRRSPSASGVQRTCPPRGTARSPRRSRRLAVALLAAATLIAPAARAQGTLFMSWHDCPSSPAAAPDFRAACETVSDVDLVLAFELPQAVDGVVALLAQVDLQSAASTLPTWWDYAPSGCRYGQL